MDPQRDPNEEEIKHLKTQLQQLHQSSIILLTMLEAVRAKFHLSKEDVESIADAYIESQTAAQLRQQKNN